MRPDGRTENVTDKARWISLNPAVALVSPNGLVAGLAAGSANIVAEYADASAQMSMHVR